LTFFSKLCLFISSHPFTPVPNPLLSFFHLQLTPKRDSGCPHIPPDHLFHFLYWIPAFSGKFESTFDFLLFHGTCSWQQGCWVCTPTLFPLNKSHLLFSLCFFFFRLSPLPVRQTAPSGRPENRPLPCFSLFLVFCSVLIEWFPPRTPFSVPLPPFLVCLKNTVALFPPLFWTASDPL